MTDEPEDNPSDEPEPVDDNVADLQRRIKRLQRFGWSDDPGRDPTSYPTRELPELEDGQAAEPLIWWTPPGGLLIGVVALVDRTRGTWSCYVGEGRGWWEEYDARDIVRRGADVGPEVARALAKGRYEDLDYRSNA